MSLALCTEEDLAVGALGDSFVSPLSLNHVTFLEVLLRFPATRLDLRSIPFLMRSN